MTADPMRETDDPGQEATLGEAHPAGQKSHDLHFYKRLHARLHRNRVTSLVTKVVVTFIGGLVVLAGIVMMVTPGPGIVAIVVGLGILATEWDWAERWMHAARAKAHAAAERARHEDPAVQRRRVLLVSATVVVVSAAVIGYLVVYDWPGFAVDGWDWVQDISGAVPDLPGM
ncbi:PGPGW domain-containing protein [Nocardioides pacificus]